VAGRSVRWALRHAEWVVYRVAGLPVAVAALLSGKQDGPAADLRAIYAAHFWNPDDLLDLTELLLAAVIWPVGLAAAVAGFLWINGSIVRSRCGKSRTRQLTEQLRAYFSAGILPPWYYMFELHDGRCDGRAFLNRFETKRGIYPLLRKRTGASSPLDDKLAFAERCRSHQIRTVPVIAAASNGRLELFEGDHLPDVDLFVKPIEGTGGKGAERWDRCDGGYRSRSGGFACEDDLCARLRKRSRSCPMLVQPRVRNCDELGDINNGALSTFRIVTCLDERGRPEVVAAVMRMAIGDNDSVDNFHSGGIAAAIELASGELGSASDLGMNARRGWIDRHPDSGAQIRGRPVPQWKEACRLAAQAHRAFDDRTIVGWDIAPTQDGPIIVEGNGSPDLDIVQRTTRSGLADSRLSQLLSHHLTRTRPLYRFRARRAFGRASSGRSRVAARPPSCGRDNGRSPAG
jgi:hypothetical protein